MQDRYVKISIIVPVYNTELYLKRCAESLINQTLKDIEIICINDGSTDNSYEILKKYEGSNFIVINQENSGVSNTRNKGIKEASGEYIMFVDSDDWLELSACEELYKNAVENKSDIVLFSHFEADENLNTYKNNMLNEINTDKDVFYSDEDTYQKLIKGYLGVWGKLYKTSFIKNNGINFSDELKVGEDQIFCFLAFSKNPLVSLVKKPLYYYFCKRADSAVNSDYALKEHLKTCNFILDKDFFNTLSNNNKCLTLNRMMQTLIWYIDKSDDKNIYKDCRNDIVKFMEVFKKISKGNPCKYKNYKKLKSRISIWNKAAKFIFEIKNRDDKKILTFLGFKIACKRL